MSDIMETVLVVTQRDATTTLQPLPNTPNLTLTVESGLPGGRGPTGDQGPQGIQGPEGTSQIIGFPDIVDGGNF